MQITVLAAVVKVAFFVKELHLPQTACAACARNMCLHFFFAPHKKNEKKTLPSSLLLFPFPRLVQLHGSAATAEMQLEFLSRPLKPDLSSAFTN